MFKRFITFCIVCSCFFIVGCSSVKDVDLDSIIDNIAKTTILENMKEGDSKTLKRYFGLNSKDFEDFVLYTPSYTMDVEELLILKLKDNSQIDFVEDIIESRVDKQIETFGSYGPDQCALLEEYELKVKDKYVFYTVSENSDEIIDIFKESIK